MEKSEKGSGNVMPLRETLEELGLSIEAAAKRCGISVRLMDILVGGGMTLPSIAKQVGYGLGLTREQVKLLGQAIDRERFRRRTGVEPLAVDCDPTWWRSYRSRRQDKRQLVRPYLNEGRMMEHLLRMGADLSMIQGITEGRTGSAINHENASTRLRLIRAIEEHLHLPEGELQVQEKPEGGWELMFLLNEEAISRIMAERELTVNDLGKRLAMRRWSAYRILERAKEGEAVTIETAEKLARVLGVDVKAIGRKIVRRRKDKSVRYDNDRA